MKEQLSSSHPLEAIASKFETHEGRLHPNTAEKILHHQKRAEPLAGGAPCPVLSPQLIQAPALLIDNELRIVWQNEAAKTQLWRRPDISEGGNGAHLFDWLLNPEFRRTVINWREWSLFFIRQTQPLITQQELQRLIEQRDEAERELLQSLLNDPETGGGINTYPNGVRQIVRDGSADTNFCVVGTTFDKGRLLVFEKSSPDVAGQTTAKRADLQQRFAGIRQHPGPVKKTFYALAARLNNAETLRAEMLDEDYSRLLHRLWEDAIETMEQNSGIVAQSAGDALMGFFLPADQFEHNPLSAIQCALELKTRMSELGREWKIRKGWLHDIELNIGIDAGTEYLVSLSSALGENLIPSGDAVQVATYLARLALNGQIWTTKALINQVPSNDLKSISFGIFRNDNNRQTFIAKSFLRIRDVLENVNFLLDAKADFGARPVTQIFDRMAHAQ
ncbi:MAG: hypothetical protein C4519_11880 [Desulfobacteraceae bacterium]|nr:MAG: hypothetical protein C4519_11880 [Desulfobacteraceae bacterium]